MTSKYDVVRGYRLGQKVECKIEMNTFSLDTIEVGHQGHVYEIILSEDLGIPYLKIKWKGIDYKSMLPIGSSYIKKVK